MPDRFRIFGSELVQLLALMSVPNWRTDDTHVQRYSEGQIGTGAENRLADELAPSMLVADSRKPDICQRWAIRTTGLGNRGLATGCDRQAELMGRALADAGPTKPPRCLSGQLVQSWNSFESQRFSIALSSQGWRTCSAPASAEVALFVSIVARRSREGFSIPEVRLH